MTLDTSPEAQLRFAGAMLQLAGERQALLEALVRHLALTYGDNEPVFAGADGRGTVDGQPLELAARLRDLYRDLVPGKVPAGAELAWVECSACGQWSCHRVLE